MPLQSGTTFGNYEIVAPIGAGGMGEVYRAKDTKLDRDVAIKVLPEELARDEERLKRFEREAKLLAQLNHTNIATIHGLEEFSGQPLLVMELVEGETLAERIARGPIAVDEAIPIFTQVAEGLEAAHDKGIIHRDLKPANIMITQEGQVKILDFGLAKAFQEDTAPSEDASQSPTMTKGTQLGVILGTASYMSPEQARGKLVDKRTDLWAFGCCLYEALTGRKAFVGETTTDTLAAIVNAEPDWNRLAVQTPASVRRLLERCLTKNVRERLTDAGMARIELKEPRTSAGDDDVVPSRALQQPRVLLLLAAALVAVTAAVTWSWRGAPAAEMRRVSITVPRGLSLLAGVPGRQFDISPDGQWIAYVAVDENKKFRLYLRALDDFGPRRIDTGDSDATLPHFSKDSKWLAYYDSGAHSLVRVPVQGGRPETVCRTLEVVNYDWKGRDGQEGIVLSRRNAGLGECELGGSSERLTETDPDLGERAHITPSTLPGGAGVLLSVRKVPSDAELAVLAFGESEPRLLGVSGSSPQYAATGHIVYAVDGGLRAVAFDLSRLEVSGESFPIPVDAAAEPQGPGRSDAGAYFTVADDGTLIYVPGEQLAQSRRSLVWVDREGGVEPVAMPPMNIHRLEISPSGNRVAFEAREDEQGVWVWDFDREALTRVTFDPAGSGVPHWVSEDRLLFESHRIPPGDVYAKAADGTGSAERVFASPNHQVPMSISPDGKHIVIEERVGASGNYDLVLFSYETQTIEPLVATEFRETSAAISPNGRFVAYQSDELGRTEVYVRPFPDAGSGKWPVSSTGGSHPAWSRDGRELFFLDGEGRLSSVDVEAGESFVAGRPRTILQQSYFDPTDRGTPYDVSPDGERFLMIDEQDTFAPTEIHVVLNWFEELERLAAAAGN